MYMKKKEKLPKKILVFCLVIIFGCESFAAAVSDNDGAAFITNELSAYLIQFNFSKI